MELRRPRSEPSPPDRNGPPARPINFAVFEFTDTDIVRTDPEVPALLLDHLWHVWHRQLVTGVPTEIPVPWYSTPDRVIDWARELQQRMERRGESLSARTRAYRSYPNLKTLVRDRDTEPLTRRRLGSGRADAPIRVTAFLGEQSRGPAPHAAAADT